MQRLVLESLAKKGFVPSRMSDDDDDDAAAAATVAPIQSIKEGNFDK